MRQIQTTARLTVCIFFSLCSPWSIAQPDLPDFAGVWVPAAPGGGGGGPGQRMRPQVTPEAQQIMDAYDLLVDDPAYECSPASISRAFANPTPTEIEQHVDRVVIRHEYMDVVRTVYVDGRQHPENTTPGVLGHSVGHYDDSTLVIESAGFSPSVISTVTGLPQTESLRTTERLTLSEDGAAFRYELTHEDPATFTQPWTLIRRFRRAPDMTLLEFACVLEDAGYEIE